MIRGLILTLFLSAMTTAEAAVPYAQLEKLRSMTVVARVALDAPESSQVKSCGRKVSDFATIGAALQLQTENFKASWGKLSLTAQDLVMLQAKTQICAVRGSCGVYDEFLSSVKNADIELKKIVGEKSEKMDSKSYLTAWSSVKNPCDYLRTLLK